MPLRFRSDDKPVVEFDPRLEISPFTLFRRLSESQDLLLVDVRPEPRLRTLEGALHLPGAHWSPEESQETVLFDDDGTAAVELSQELQSQGFSRVRALFGGLDLYEFSLDPAVVGEQTFLVPIDDSSG